MSEPKRIIRVKVGEAHIMKYPEEIPDEVPELEILEEVPELECTSLETDNIMVTVTTKPSAIISTMKSVKEAISILQKWYDYWEAV